MTMATAIPIATVTRVRRHPWIGSVSAASSAMTGRFRCHALGEKRCSELDDFQYRALTQQEKTAGRMDYRYYRSQRQREAQIASIEAQPIGQPHSVECQSHWSAREGRRGIKHALLVRRGNHIEGFCGLRTTNQKPAQ